METYQPLYSSNIERVDYEEDAQDLTVRFTSGSAYAYHGVPRETFLGLQNARSAGEYFSRQIKNLFPYEQVE